MLSFQVELPHALARRRLRGLRAAADADPADAAKFAELVQALNGARCGDEVIQLVEAGKHALNSAAAAGFLRALGDTGRLSEYARGEPVRAGEAHRSLPELLRQLQARLAAGGAVAAAPGRTATQPLHVMLQVPPRPPPTALDALRAVALGGASFLAFMVLFVSASYYARRQAMRSIVSSSAAMAASRADLAAATRDAPSFAPKEYNKENVPEVSRVTFADVKGCSEAKAELEEVVEFLKSPTKFTRLGGRLPKGILLTGPPGTGKTLLARAIAGEAGVPFFFRAGSEFEEMFVGVGSRRVRELFAAAKKKAPCIVFIDEIDAVGASRKVWDGTSGTRKTLNQLLVEMDGFEAAEGVIVVAATNYAESLDAALTRPGRFDRHVAVPLPDIRGRHEILMHYLKDKPGGLALDAALLARQTPGMSGADLANLVNEAALIAGKRGMPTLTPAMLDEAMDKAVMGGERKMVRSADARRRTAYHESGHALVAVHTPGALDIHKATIVPRGHALGLVAQVLGADKDEWSQTRQQIGASIDICMGGRVAEELVFGSDQVSTGASQDLQQATRIARMAVAECGMSEAIGPVYVERGGGAGPPASADLQRRVDGEVGRVLHEAHARVTVLLAEKEAELHTLAGALLEHETLSGADIPAEGGAEGSGVESEAGDAAGEGGVGDAATEGRVSDAARASRVQIVALDVPGDTTARAARQAARGGGQGGAQGGAGSAGAVSSEDG
ncbi:hypothetical protein WJX81_006501 [Elliptochloris bilobata]|uniref:AAA+ ATPase domain-containing protein n=1 Tax=Elliptochloris bilobata TaxID=381761 RepID=A0AAW1RV04_9CHLO